MSKPSIRPLSSRIARFGLALAAAVAVAGFALPAAAQEAIPALKPARESWSFAGPFGHYDREQLQRGFKVYKEVCSACHSLHRVAFRNLSEPGGPEFTEGQVKALAATYTIADFDDKGQPVDRPGRAADYFPLVFPNDDAARAANHGAVPPDMSLLAKARGTKSGFPWFISDVVTQYQEQGPDYIHALITYGYLGKDEKVPEVESPDPNDPTKTIKEPFKVPDGLNYNKVFPAHSIAMAKPLQDGQVEYTDGAPQTVDQYTRDAAAFLNWAADPSLEERKRTGFKVLIFLIVLSGLLYYTKKKVWAEAH
ncbi:ubiquinol-cytochrome c reductase cytochrome b/c1 subunit [Labrys monachus]|uniref:Cytochrome c1 n=1 Tax=Labrys monachus TaxID=217067 RepID=A0ABU0FJA5_9HYPH|nr:ubiquinol-cytochrome c reductase cytochrome b/c1 subunit [Labrys monachus]